MKKNDKQSKKTEKVVVDEHAQEPAQSDVPVVQIAEAKPEEPAAAPAPEEVKGETPAAAPAAEVEPVKERVFHLRLSGPQLSKLAQIVQRQVAINTDELKDLAKIEDPAERETMVALCNEDLANVTAIAALCERAAKAP